MYAKIDIILSKACPQIPGPAEEIAKLQERQQKLYTMIVQEKQVKSEADPSKVQNQDASLSPLISVYCCRTMSAGWQV